MLPSRDQTPPTSSVVSNVNRELVPRLRSPSQILTSFAFASAMWMATRVPSGDNVEFETTPISPTCPSSLPARSYQVRTESVAPRVALETMVPFSDTEKVPQEIDGW